MKVKAMSACGCQCAAAPARNAVMEPMGMPINPVLSHSNVVNVMLKKQIVNEARKPAVLKNAEDNLLFKPGGVNVDFEHHIVVGLRHQQQKLEHVVDGAGSCVDWFWDEVHCRQ